MKQELQLLKLKIPVQEKGVYMFDLALTQIAVVVLSVWYMLKEHLCIHHGMVSYCIWN